MKFFITITIFSFIIPFLCGHNTYENVDSHHNELFGLDLPVSVADEELPEETTWHSELKRHVSGRFVMPILHEDLIFYLTNEGIKVFDKRSRESRLVFENENIAYLSNIDGGFLYFSLGDGGFTLSDDSIYRMSLNDGVVELVYTHSHWDFGFSILDDRIYLYELWEILRYDMANGHIESIFSYDEYLSLVFTEDAFFFISFSQRDASIYKKSRSTGEVRLMRGAGDIRLLEEDVDNEVFRLNAN